MTSVLTKIQPFHPPLEPPPNAVAVGVTPDGKQLYREVTTRSRAVPATDPKTGERLWAKNPMTAEPLYPRNKPEIYEYERVYFLESEGNGNVAKRDWRPPSPDELAKAERRQRVLAMQEQLAEALVDAAVSPEDLLAGLLAGQSAEVASRPAAIPAKPEQTAPAVAESEPAADASKEFPYMYGPGLWRLSNGQTFRGKKEEAFAQEAAVPAEERERYQQALAEAEREAKATAASTPEY